MDSLKIESFDIDERAADPVFALGRDLGLAAVPRSFVCIDISTNQGRDTVAIVSLAKKEEEIFLPGRSDPLRLSRRSPSLRLLQRARDEAHRFAVSYSRKRRAARTITSELLAVPGIGPSRRRALLERFGSLAGVKSATPAEIAALPGFSISFAERILDRLKAG